VDRPFSSEISVKAEKKNLGQNNDWCSLTGIENPWGNATGGGTERSSCPRGLEGDKSASPKPQRSRVGWGGKTMTRILETKKKLRGVKNKKKGGGYGRQNQKIWGGHQVIELPLGYRCNDCLSRTCFRNHRRPQLGGFFINRKRTQS